MLKKSCLLREFITPRGAASQTQLNNTHTVVAQVHQPDIQTTTQDCQNRLYPDLNLQNNQQGMQSNSGLSARRTLYHPLSGDTTNPHTELPDPPLLDDEQLVVDVATQQNGVPASQQVRTLQPCHEQRCVTNLPADYDTVTPLQQSQQQTQIKQVETGISAPTRTTVTAQSQPHTSTSCATGEKLSLHVQDGPYGPLLRYDHSDGNLYYLVAHTLESF